MQTFQTQIVHHPEGRCYQAFTANFKRQLIVLVEYGKNPLFIFEYKQKGKQSFQMRDVCALQVIKVELSLDGKYLAVVCGTPDPKLIIIDIEQRCVLKGSKNCIELDWDTLHTVNKIQFNPASSKQLAVSFGDRIELYELKQCFEVNKNEEIEQTISIRKIDTIGRRQESNQQGSVKSIDHQAHDSNYRNQQNLPLIEFFTWDQINNLYVSSNNEIYVYSTDTKHKVVQYEIEPNRNHSQMDSDNSDSEINDDENSNLTKAVRNIILTKKHAIVLYRNGRIEWLIKYYPDLMEQDDASLRPFYLDKYFETKKEIISASYNGDFSKIFLTFGDACFGILPKVAQNNEPDQGQEENIQPPQNMSMVNPSQYANYSQHPNSNLNSNAQQAPDKALEIELTLSQPYHASPIVLIHEYLNTSVCLTLSTAGRLIFWSVKQSRQVGSHQIEKDVVCAAVSKQGNVLSTGHADGVVRFYSIAKMQDVFLFKELRMIDEQLNNTGRVNFTQPKVDQVIFSSNGEQLAVFSKKQNRVFYLLTEFNGNTFSVQVLGYIKLPHQGRSISWIGPMTKSHIPARFQYLLVAAGHALLMINGPVATPTKYRGKELELLKCEIYAVRTDLEQNLAFGLPSGEILTTGEDLLWKKYKQPEDLHEKIDFKSKMPPGAPLDEIQAHDFETRLILRQQNDVIISVGKQGTIHIRDSMNLKAILGQIRAFGWKHQNMSSVSGSWVKGVIYVAGKDGSFYIWNLSKKGQGSDPVDTLSAKGQDTVGNLQAPNKSRRIKPQPQLKYYEQIIEEEYLQLMKDTISRKKKVQFEKLERIRTGLQALLEQNEQHQQLQRLQRDQFAIDLQSKEKLKKQGEKKCRQIVQQSKHKILHTQVYAKRLKEITYDRMQVHLSAINGLKNRYLVYNYQLRKVSRQEKRQVKLILELRRQQKRQERRQLNAGEKAADGAASYGDRATTANGLAREDLKNRNVVNGGVPTPLIITQLQARKQDKKDDKKKQAKKDADDPSSMQPADGTGIEEPPVQEQWSLLYSSFQLFNPNAKRNQVIMMHNIISLIKKTFNKEFNKLAKLRQGQNQLINDKNKRIAQICQELKRNSQVIVTKDNLLENQSDAVLTVTDKEVGFERYLSREERQKLAKEKAREEQRLRRLAEDDSAQRALQNMMGGTLQEKKVSALQIKVEREKWMDKPVEQMSEEEKTKMKEYEQKRQKAQQERERLVKKLEAELRKLRQQIDQTMQKYDEKLFELLKRRIEYDYRIEQQELYCARLALSMLTQQQEQKRHSLLTDRLDNASQKMQMLDKARQQLQSHQTQFQQQRQAKRQAIQRERLGQYESKVKTIEKSIFEEFHTNVKKRREMCQKVMQNNPELRNQIIALDPMIEIQTRLLTANIGRDYKFFTEEIKALQRTFEIPENTIERILEHRFNLKKEEHLLEDKQKVLAGSVQGLEKEAEDEQQSFAEEQDEIARIEKFLMKCRSDLDIQVRVKQGQVEVNNEKPVPVLEDALLLPRSEIQEKNVKIRKQASEKISVMKEIKTCKIKVTEEGLNLQKKQEHIERLSAMLREIQMLKVKKQMQLALNKKDTKINENELKSLKDQIQKVRKEGEKRIALYIDKINKVQRQIDSIKNENKQLETQKWTLDGTVKQRQKIKDMMCGDGQAGHQAAEKFDQISVNRKLFDKAKQQTEEIELLRQELSKLKAKTFANFSNVQR